MPKPPDNRTLGDLPLKRGYLNDSMGLGIDKGAWYHFEAHDRILTALWRVGLPRPKNLHPIKKAP